MSMNRRLAEYLPLAKTPMKQLHSNSLSYVLDIALIIAISFSFGIWISGDYEVVSLNTLSALLILLLIYLFFWITNINRELGILPNKIILSISILGAVYQVVNSLILSDLMIFAASVLAGLVFFLTLYFIYSISRGAFIGGGDVKMSFAAGVVLGFSANVVPVLIFALAGLFIYFLTHRNNRKVVPSGVMWAFVVSATLLLDSANLDIVQNLI